MSTRQVQLATISFSSLTYNNYSLGNIYIADTYNQRVRKVMVSTGIITTIAGAGTSSYSGDNGPATAATFYGPNGVSVDTSGKPRYSLTWIY